MRKINGITINGEYLGNSVVINGMFRAICTISPIIMRDFVLIINQIERLEEAVKINNFNCGFDCIDIEFNNSNKRGIASLYFKLVNGEPELTDCKLVINDEEYATISERRAVCVPEASVVEEQPQVQEEPNEDEIARKEKINEIKAKRLEELRAKKELLKNKKNSNNVTKTAIPAQKDEPPKSRLEKLLEQKRKIAEAKAGKNNEKADDKKNPDTLNSSVLEPETQNLTQESKENITKKDTKDDKKSSDSKDTIGEKETMLSAETNDEIVSDEAKDSTYTNSNETKINKFDNLDDIDIEDLSEEELAQLEAELEAEMEAEANAEDEQYKNYDNEISNTNYQGFDNNFAETLSQGLINGLSQGLSEGLAQGLSQGISQGFAQMANQIGNSFGNNVGYQDNQNFNSGFNDNFNSNMQTIPNSFDSVGGFNFADSDNTKVASFKNEEPYKPTLPDYNQIDNINYNASIEARDSYSYDENSNLDDLSDLYSDFYDENRISESYDISDSTSSSSVAAQEIQNIGPDTSAIDALKAELEALRSQTSTKKDLMSLDEFLAKQRELEEAKENMRRQRFRIVGSRGRVNASALDGGVFVAGKKVYKWGETKVLDE